MTEAPPQRWWALSALSLTVLFSWGERATIVYLLPNVGRSYGWSVSEIGSRGGLLFSVFFVGYGIALITLSGMAQRIGPIRSLYIVVIGSALVTMSTGAGAALMGRTSFPLMVGFRFLLGIVEGVHIPMIATLVRAWFPLSERSRANAFFVNAALLANLAAPWAIVPTAERLGWQTTIVVIGASSLLSFPLLCLISRHPALMRDGGDEAAERDAPPGTTQELRALFAPLLVLGVCLNLCTYALFSWLPAYLDHLSPETGGARLAGLLTIPTLASGLGIALLAWLGDRWGHKLRLSAVGFGVMAFFIGLTARSASVSSALACASIALFGLMAYGAQETALVQRVVSARSTGKSLGWYNGLGMLIGGSTGTYGFGRLLASTARYDLALLALIPVALLAAAIAALLSRRLAY